MKNFQERAHEADLATSKAVVEVIERWKAEDADPQGLVFPADLFRPAIVGMCAASVRMAYETGVVGATAESILEGYQRTIANMLKAFAKNRGDVGDVLKTMDRDALN